MLNPGMLTKGGGDVVNSLQANSMACGPLRRTMAKEA
jgi:hypothetical protein